jgi:hypothetical protein
MTTRLGAPRLPFRRPLRSVSHPDDDDDETVTATTSAKAKETPAETATSIPAAFVSKWGFLRSHTHAPGNSLKFKLSANTTAPAIVVNTATDSNSDDDFARVDEAISKLTSQALLSAESPPRTRFPCVVSFGGELGSMRVRDSTPSAHRSTSAPKLKLVAILKKPKLASVSELSETNIPQHRASAPYWPAQSTQPDSPINIPESPTSSPFGSPTLMAESTTPVVPTTPDTELPPALFDSQTDTPASSGTTDLRQIRESEACVLDIAEGLEPILVESAEQCPPGGDIDVAKEIVAEQPELPQIADSSMSEQQTQFDLTESAVVSPSESGATLLEDAKPRDRLSRNFVILCAWI